MAKLAENIFKISNESEKEVLIKKAIREVLNRKERRIYEKNLKNNYGIYRHSGNKKITKKQYYRLKFIAIAATFIIILAVGGRYLMQPNVDPLNAAFLLVQNDDLLDPRITKGTSVIENEIITEAIIAFNNGQIEKSIALYTQLSNINQESQFYLGVAYLKSSNYPLAIQHLEKINLNNSPLAKEIKWYLGLSYILDNNYADAADILGSITEGEWRFDEAQELIRSLNNIK